jgi:hypothetical protein
MPESSFTPPQIPLHLAQFPTIGGLVIPFTTLQHRNGKAALGLVDGSRLELCLRERRCGVCGQAIADRMVFLMRQSDLQRKCSVEPPLCPPCAAYTQQACPMVGGYMAHYRDSVAPFVARRCDDELCQCQAWVAPTMPSARQGAAAETWYALWTRQYRLTRDSDDRIVANFSGLRVLAIREIRRT